MGMCVYTVCVYGCVCIQCVYVCVCVVCTVCMCVCTASQMNKKNKNELLKIKTAFQ